LFRPSRLALPDRPTRPESATNRRPGRLLAQPPFGRDHHVRLCRHPGVRAPRHCAAVQDSPSVSLRPATSRRSGSGKISVAAP